MCVGPTDGDGVPVVRVPGTHGGDDVDHTVEGAGRLHMSGDDERRRYYRLTPFGKRVLSAELSRLRELLALAEAQRVAESLP